MTCTLKVFALTLLILLVGCAPLTTLPSGAPNLSSAPDGPAPPPEPIGPRMILPVTGGAPVLGIPLGGGVYLPVTGEAPVFGIPL